MKIFAGNTKKRGSMALSMNAIVVIILAMAMLGVGIFIVNKIRGEAAGVIDIETPSLKSPADATNPVVLGREELEISQGEVTTFRVSIYNTFADDRSVYLNVGSCRGTHDAETLFNTGESESLIGTPSMAGRNEKTFRVMIGSSDINTAGVTVCTLEATAGDDAEIIGSADLMVDVK